MTAYLKTDIAAKIEETPRKIQTWTDIGLVEPDIVPSRGRGHARVYSEKNLIEFCMAKILKDYDNINLELIKIMLGALRKGSAQLSTGSKKVNFSDFYNSSKWGTRKEIIFLFFIGHNKDLMLVSETGNGDLTFAVHMKKTGLNISNEKERVHIEVKLGETKKSALEFLGMT
ncbi:MAG: MerR family transcriptional regulator [bacterium]